MAEDDDNGIATATETLPSEAGAETRENSAPATMDDRAAALEAWQRRRAARGSSSAGAAVVEVVNSDEPAPSGWGAKLRGFINSSTGGTDSDDDGSPRRGRRPAVKPEDLAAGVIVPILSLAFLAVPAHVRMRQDEMSGVAVPLARILMRRIRALRRMSPDIIDLFAIMAVITVYVRRLQFESAQRAATARRAAEEYNARNRAAGPANGSAAGFAGAQPSGDALAAYLGGYRQ